FRRPRGARGPSLFPSPPLFRSREARSSIDDLAVSTDIIVGFPGETDAEADATLEVAAEAAFDSAYTFIYSPRPGTEAAELTDRLDRKSTRLNSSHVKISYAVFC